MRSLSPALLSVALLLAGCAERTVLTRADRATLRGTQVRPPGAPLAETLYTDHTSEAAFASAVVVSGVAPATISGRRGAAYRQAVRARFGPAMERQRGAVREVVAGALRRAVRRAGKDVGTPDSEISVILLEYGVAHKGDQRFAARVSGRVRIARRDGTPAAERVVAGESETLFSTEDPGRYGAALREAAVDFGGKAVAGLWGLGRR